jgi:hypothetical protein|tara:strand:- start:1050 stop:1751 length:702 start_codon:yes stop_codon:yes gene_type:complete
MSYAVGKYAKAICDRCGFEYPYLKLQEEWNGQKTCPQCYEPKHPQLTPSPPPADAEALYQPRIFTKIESVEITFPTVDLDTLQFMHIPSLPGKIGDVSITGPSSTFVSGVAGTAALGSITVQGINVLSVTVVSTGSGNKYFIDGAQQPTLNLSEGSTYQFDQSDSSNSGHPLRFSTTSDGTHGGGSEYTTGVTTSGTPGNAGAYTQITVAVGAPTLYYYCSVHSGMGGQANTP